MSVSEIHALIQLLDDPDENVYMHVREQLLSKGTEILPAVMEHRSSNNICAVYESRLDELVVIQNHLANQRAKVGARLNSVERQQDIMNERKILVEKDVSELADADLSQLVTELQSMMTVLLRSKHQKYICEQCPCRNVGTSELAESDAA